MSEKQDMVQVATADADAGGGHLGMEAVALWMMDHGYATGHGDTLDDLLTEIELQARDADRQTLVARIKRSSKYWGQTAPDQWFDVRVVSDTYYQLRGNSNNYRLVDVVMGIRFADGTIVDLKTGKKSS